MDRFTRGLVAGMIAGIPMNIWDLTAYYTKLSNIRLLDWGSIIAFGHLPQNSIDLVIGQTSQLLWVGFLGVLFSFFVPLITSRTVLLKGAFYGFITGFILYAIPVIMGTRYLSNATTGSSISHSIGGIIWGITLAQTLRILNKKTI